jgi:TetR/AcrR family transcriptional repressor of nem operon
MDRKPKRPGKTRDLDKTRAAILQAAFLLVLKHGFQGVSIDDIVEETRFTKGAFYHLFPTKLDLGYALVDEVIRPLIIDRWITPLEDFENPLAGILSQMQKLIGGETPELLKLGCPLNNLVQEMAPLDAGFKRRLRSALDLWVNETERYLKKAKAGGFLKSSVNTQEAAHFIVMAHEGSYGLIKGLGKAEAFAELFGSLKIYFQAILTNELPVH